MRICSSDQVTRDDGKERNTMFDTTTRHALALVSAVAVTVLAAVLVAAGAAPLVGGGLVAAAAFHIGRDIDGLSYGRAASSTS